MSKQDDESNESNSKRAERMEFLVRLWTQHYIPAASEARKRFMRDFNEVEEYFQGDHTALYTKIAEFMNPEGLLCLTVNLAQEVRGYIGPHLYARNPARTVNPKSNNEPMRCLAKIQEAYLNATPEDTKLKDEYRKVVDEALIAGRGASWTVKDPWTKLVTTRHVPIRDVYLDPDARCLADCQWIAIRRQEPLHVLKKRREPAKPGDKDRLGIKWDTDGLKPDVLTPSDDSVERWTEGGRTLHEEVAKKKGKTSHVVRYWVIYSKMGTGLSLGKLPNGEERFRGEDSGNRFTKLVLVPGFDRPLFKGDWDLSLYLDDDWPIGFMDFTPTLIGSRNEETESDNGGLWPVSLVKLAIGHQKAIDLLVTRWINDLFQRARMIGVVPAQATDSVMRAFQSGDPWTAIELASDAAGVPIRDLFHLLQLGQVDPTFREQLQYHESKFGQVTGMLPTLMGSGGDQGGQIRSATEADLRDKNSRSRIEDMNSIVESEASASGRREGIAVRVNLAIEEVERVVKDKIQLNKWKLEVIAGGEALSLKVLGKLWEPAGTYFSSPQEAQQIAAQIQQNEPAFRAAWRGSEGEDFGVLVVNVIPVTVREVWNDTEANPRELALQLGYTVQAGSARQLDVNMKIGHADMVMGLVGQVALQLQQYHVYNKALRVAYQARQVPEEDRVFLDEQAIQRQQEAMQQQQQQAMQAEQQARQQDMQAELMKIQAAQQGELQRVQVEQKAKAEGLIATTAAKVAMDPVGGGGVR